MYGWMNDLDLHVIPKLCHKGSSDFFCKTLKKNFLPKLHQIDIYDLKEKKLKFLIIFIRVPLLIFWLPNFKKKFLPKLHKIDSKVKFPVK
jgi:hypothetical protein